LIDAAAGEEEQTKAERQGREGKTAKVAKEGLAWQVFEGGF
jgi:hypothetical protein